MDKVQAFGKNLTYVPLFTMTGRVNMKGNSSQFNQR